MGRMEVLDKGPRQIEYDAALPLGSGFRNHVGDRHGLAHTGRANEHRMALFKPPGIGDRGDMRWPVRKDPGDLSRQAEPPFPAQRGIELTGALAPVVRGQFIDELGERNQHRAALVFALLGATAEPLGEPVEDGKGWDQEEPGTPQGTGQKRHQLLPRMDHRRIAFELGNRKLDGRAKGGFQGDLFGGIELHEAVDGSVDPHPDEIDFMVGEACRNGPP